MKGRFEGYPGCLLEGGKPQARKEYVDVCSRNVNASIHILAGHARWDPVLCGKHGLEARHQGVNLDGFCHIGGRAQTPRLLFRFLSITDRDHDYGNIAQWAVAF